MASIVAEFLGVIGVSVVIPTNLAELIPYLLTVFLGVVLVSGVFAVIGGIARSIVSMRRL